MRELGIKEEKQMGLTNGEIFCRCRCGGRINPIQSGNARIGVGNGEGLLAQRKPICRAPVSSGKDGFRLSHQKW